MAVSVFAGIDLAAKRDFTAVVLVNVLDTGFSVTAAHRLAHGPWKNQMAGIARLTAGCEGAAIDGTGVGALVVEQLRGRLTVPLVSVVFTPARKTELIESLIETLYNERLTVVPEAPGRDQLREELQRFSMSPTRRGAVYSGKKHGTDDLVIALALAVYAARLRPEAWRFAYGSLR